MQSLKYLKYQLFADTKYKVHSPFVFELLTEVIQHKDAYYAYQDIERLRQQLLSSKATITVNDLGAGSRVFKSDQRKVSAIAQHSLAPPKYAQLLFRLVNHFKPQTLLELGTSLGITTLYLAAPNSKATVYTHEGCAATLEVAQQNFDQMQQQNIVAVQGNFNDTLPQTLQQLQQLDFAFIDGNHSKAPTLAYFEQCLTKVHNNSVLVFDDIHWSAEMEAAWHIIQQHPTVTVTIDLFRMGLVFFRKEQEKEHFTIRF